MKKVLILAFFCWAFYSFAFSQDSEEKIKPAKKFSVSKGIVRLDLFTEQGTFGIYAVTPDGPEKSVLASRSVFSSSGFFLRTANSIFQLNKSGGIPSVCRVEDGKAEIDYSLRKGRVKADVKVSLSIENTVPGKDADMVKITVETVNTGSKRQTFALRGILDTVLGEQAYTDFSTAQIRHIDSELKFDSMLADKWILSKNAVNGMQILLAGRGITSPKSVILANRDIITAGDWDGFYYREGRAYTSILSYQNSAVDLVWNDFVLSPGQKTAITFYIVLSIEGTEPAGLQFLNSLVEPVPLKTVEALVISPVQIPSLETEEVSEVKEVSEESEVLDGDSEPEKDSESSKDSEPAEKKDVEEVPFDVSTVKKEQLDPAYVQSLLDRINSLEDSDSSIDQANLLKLNAELDAIINAIRNQ